jgi:hypothetical protein
MDDEERQRRIKIVVGECQGIQPPYVAFYIEAIFYAAERGQIAFDRFIQLVADKGSASDIVASAHEALGHAAALSRFFFPVDKKPLARARAANLRQLFAVSNHSALQDRELRNALEHFDERLDEYLLGDIAGYLFPGPMVDDAELADDPVGHIFRLVDPATQTFVLLGQKHAFGAMRAEVAQIAEAAAKLR